MVAEFWESNLGVWVLSSGVHITHVLMVFTLVGTRDIAGDREDGERGDMGAEPGTETLVGVPLMGEGWQVGSCASGWASVSAESIGPEPGAHICICTPSVRTGAGGSVLLLKVEDI